MSISNVSQALDEVLESLPEDLDDYLFLFTSLIILYFFWQETQGHEPEAVAIPKFFIIMSAFFIFIMLALKLIPDGKVWIVGEDSSQDTGLEKEFDDPTHLDVNLLSSVRSFAWIVGYLVGVWHIGYFTSTFAFVVAYVISREYPDVRPKVVLISVLVGAFVDVFIWVLFIDLMRNAAILDFGVYL